MKNSYTKPNLKTKYFEDLFNSLPSMENKSVAITGTTSGLGFYAAESVAKLGARVLLLNRPSDRAETSYALLNDNCSNCLLYTSPSPRDRTRSRMPSSA